MMPEVREKSGNSSTYCSAWQNQVKGIATAQKSFNKCERMASSFMGIEGDIQQQPNINVAAVGQGGKRWHVAPWALSTANRYLRVTRGEPESAATAGIFQGSCDLIFTNKVLELAPCFTAQNFLQPSTTRLTNAHGRSAVEVRLEGIRAAVHFLAHDSF
jgi:hypothetical protein